MHYYIDSNLPIAKTGLVLAAIQTPIFSTFAFLLDLI